MRTLELRRCPRLSADYIQSKRLLQKKGETTEHRKYQKANANGPFFEYPSKMATAKTITLAVRLGPLLQTLHDQGIYHSKNLNCHNIMIDQDDQSGLLIWYKCEATTLMMTKWKLANIDKIKALFGTKKDKLHTHSIFLNTQWRNFLEG